jgi:hypothetical protein
MGEFNPLNHGGTYPLAYVSPLSVDDLICSSQDRSGSEGRLQFYKPSMQETQQKYAPVAGNVLKFNRWSYILGSKEACLKNLL